MGHSRSIRIAVTIAILGVFALGAQQLQAVYESGGKPYSGFFVFPNAVVAPTALSPRPAFVEARGLRYLDRIVAVDGQPIRSGSELQQRAAAAGVGKQLTYTVERPGGENFELTVPVVAFSTGFFRWVALPVALAGVLAILIGALPVLIRPELASTRALFIWSWSYASNYCLLAFDYVWVYSLVPWLYPLGALTKASLFHLALMFPEKRWPMGTPSQTVTLIALYGIFFLLSGLNIYSVLQPPGLTTLLDTLTIFSLAAGWLAFLASCIYTALRSSVVENRHRARIALAGPAIVFAILLGLIVPFAFGSGTEIPTQTLFLIPLFLMPLTFAYAILRYNVFEFATVLRSAMAMLLIATCAGAIAFGAFDVTRALMNRPVTWVAVLVALVVLGLVSPILGALRTRIENMLREVLFPAQRDSARALRDAGRELVRLRSVKAVAELLDRAAREAVHASSFSLVYGPATEPLRQVGGQPLPAALLASPSVRDFLSGESLADCDDHTPGSDDLEEVKQRLAEYSQCLAVPLPAGDLYRGGLFLGSRGDGRLYTSDDERLLETLAAQCSTALENGRAWDEINELRQRLEQENVTLRREIERREGFEEIVGESPGIRAAMTQIEQVAPTDASVIVLGETGTGKELIVRALHRLSSRREGPLVKLACAAIPESLVESELFGHEKGAFTGATQSKPGRFELADSGTLFLDDVDTLPLGVQAKLLRALQEGEIQRVGSAVVKYVDLRVVAATNRDLLADAQAGLFREDLYYRLAVVPIQLPPLRERREDIALLVQSFIEQESEKLDREVRPVEPELMSRLESHDWPGNIRELRNAVERAVVMSDGDVIRLSDSGLALVGAGPAGETSVSSATVLDARSLSERLHDLKVDLIRAALQESSGNQRRAAERLGLHRQSLNRMIREFGISAEDG